MAATAFPAHFTRLAAVRSSLTTQPNSAAKSQLLFLIADHDRGLKKQHDPSTLSSIVKAINDVIALGREKQQLFIVEKAPLFDMEAVDVLQVIDVGAKSLYNFIMFPPHGAFFVRAGIEVASEQRVNFKFTSTVLLGKGWEIPVPPFGQGWFDTVYLDNEIRVIRDIPVII